MAGASPDGALSVGTQLLFTVGRDQHVNGVIKFIGTLNEDPTNEEWVGVELGRRGRDLGWCDSRR